MSTLTPFEIGQKVYLLLNTGQTSQKRFEIVRVWRYPTTFRYQLDTGYVADHSELRATESDATTLAKAPAAPAPPPTPEDGE
jgi:hypothetical protein